MKCNLSPTGVKTTLVVACILLFNSASLSAQQEFDGIRGTRHWMMFSDAPNALYHYLAEQAYAFLEKRLDGISKQESVAERQAWLRKALPEAVGPFPDKTPLNAKITKKIDKDWYRLQHIIYESQPGYYVTSTLFIPAGLGTGQKAPVVIYCSGHSESGYRSPVYQQAILNLVRKGFIVFAFDPIGQGERLQYGDSKTGERRFPYPSYAHSYVGAQLFITGNTLARNFIWDGIRAVDYLLTRSEVDPNRIGITGRSGGGTQSALIAAFDDRIKAAAPENYFTNFTRLYQSLGPQDAEQNLFYGIKRGLDMADLLTVRAPKPTLMITTSRDMFPIQGAVETADEVSKTFKYFGRESDFYRVSDDAPHASTKKNREAMYRFFQKYLDNPGDPTDVDLPPLEEGELQVTATGQLMTSLGGETAFSLNKKDATKRMEKLGELRRDFPGHFSERLESAKKLSGYDEPTESTTPVFIGRIQRDGYTVEKYFVKGEGDYVIPYLLMQPQKPSPDALIYLNPEGKSAASERDGEMEWFVKQGFTVLAPDIIGTGEMGPGIFKGDSYIDSISYNLWFASMLIGRSITGIQAGDIVRLVNLLKHQNNIDEVYGLARRELSPALLHAAAFNDDIKRVALIEPYSSYRSMVMEESYAANFLHSAVAGAIGIYDLPDLAGSLAPRKLLIWGVTDGAGYRDDVADIHTDMSVINAAYQSRGTGSQVEIVPAGMAITLRESLRKWLMKH